MNFVKRIWRNPTGRRAIIWLAPIVANYVIKRLTNKSSRKNVKSKSK